MPNWLILSLIYLAAAVIAVPLARFAGLGSIIGYLVAGIAIGPFGLNLVSDPESMLHFAEFGVVLMLFLVGLELEPRRLWAMRRPIFGWGSFQLLGSAALLLSAAALWGVPWRLALVGALGLAMSSTAIGLAVLNERNLTSTTAGQGVLSVALLQDIAAIPILALVPLLALGGAHDDGDPAWIEALRALGVIAAIVLGGRLLLRPMLRWIARSKTPEIFTAAALLLVVAIAALMQSVGLSMALGAFLAGVLLAESEYRRELETDIEPFKGLLLGLFFIAVGMGIDFHVVMRHPGLIVGLVAAFLSLKALVLWAMSRTMPIPLAERSVFVVLLMQGGEFGFVVFQAATHSGVIEGEAASLLVAVVTLSMLLTPLLLLASDRWWAAHLRAHQQQSTAHRLEGPQSAPVIIAGFGRYGQIVGRLLFANGLAATVLDHDAETVEGTAPLRLAGVLRGRDPARSAARGRRGAGQGAGGGNRRRRTEPRVGGPGTPALPAADDRRARARRAPLDSAVPARSALHRARDARLCADERAQRARAAGRRAASRAHAGATLSPPQRRATGRDGAAHGRREAADLVEQGRTRATRTIAGPGARTGRAHTRPRERSVGRRGAGRRG